MPLWTVTPDDPTFPWRNFRKVTNKHWSADNTVLMGDAAHTTHFSIGHGTLLAIRDAIALANELREPGDQGAQLAAYERNQLAALLGPQADAAASAQWFENIDAHIDAPDADFFRSLRTPRRATGQLGAAAGVNSRCRCVRPRRMYVGAYS